MNILDFYKGKKIFVTGHTGFKGSWLCKILLMSGADVTGYSLSPETEPNLFDMAEIEGEMTSIIGDVRDYESLKKAFDECNPEIVFHLAAQPIVLKSYEDPKYTYETNVMGTVNLLECIRQSKGVKSFLNVTTDKVYENNGDGFTFVESDKLDGYDPYSNSKSCSELVTHSYFKSFLRDRKISVSTARAGNVIGGGDFAENRIIPDCVRACVNNEKIIIRNPYSIRPFQHVLEPIFVYLMIAAEQYIDFSKSDSYNVGPDSEDCITTGKLADIFCKAWGDNVEWVNICKKTPYEAEFLKLDCEKLKDTFNWQPVWNIEKAVEKVVEFTKEYYSGTSVSEIMEKQIKEYLGEKNV